MLLTRPPLDGESKSEIVQALNLQWAISFDLHVLGMPPAFILSQDQTLQKKYFKKLITATQIDVLLSFQRTKFSFVLPFLSDTVINISFFIFNVKCFFEVF